MSAPSLDRCAATFLASLAQKSPLTRRNYATALDHFRNFLGESGVRWADSPAVFTPTTLEEYYLWGLDTKLDPYSVRTYVSGVRAFMRYLERRAWLTHPCTCVAMGENLRAVMPPHRYKTPKIDNGAARLAAALLDRPLPASGTGRLMALRDRVIVTTLYATAMRRHELVALNVDDVRSEEALIRGKGGEHRMVFFDEESRAATRAYLDAQGDDCRPLLLRHDDGRGDPGPRGENWRLSCQMIWRVVHDEGARLGIDVHPHDFRHLKARVLLNDGAQMGEVQKYLGHDSFAVTERIYAPYTSARIRDAVRAHGVPLRDVAQDASRFIEG